MNVARARRYPQPPPSEQVLRGARCDHGELVGRCPICRAAAKPGVGQDPPERPRKVKRARRRVAAGSDQAVADPSAQQPPAPGERHADDDPWRAQ